MYYRIKIEMNLEEKNALIKGQFSVVRSTKAVRYILLLSTYFGDI